MSYLGEKNYLPKLNLSTIEFLEKIITPESLILETGTGNSTIWFARRAKRVVALENRADWCKQVQNHLRKQGLDNVKIYFDAQYPEKPFINVLSEQDTVQYDVVLLDGPNPWKARVFLIKIAPPLVKPGGYLIVDDTDRVEYMKEVECLDDLEWNKTVTPRGGDHWGSLKASIIYQRPN